jgi:hypothetical protein
MERARIRLSRLRKIAEQIKIEEQEYYEKYGDDAIKIILIKNTKMKFDRHSRRNAPQLAPAKIKFDVFKYFIQKSAHRLDEHSLQKSSLFYKQINNKIDIHFKGKEYVTIVSNRFDSCMEENRILFEALAKNKKGRLTYAEDKDETDTEYLLQYNKVLNKKIVEASIKQCYLNQLVYHGSPVEGENVLLLGDEFGLDDAISHLLVSLKPKSVLNILNDDKYSWFDNVD